MRRIIDNILKKVCLATIVVLSVTGCSKDDYLESGTGIRISLTDDVDITSRSTPSEIGGPVLSQFHLNITRQKNSEVLYDDGYTSEILRLSVGTYHLKASFGKNEILALDAPYYEGNVDAEVIADETTQAVIPCQVANALLSVKYKNQGVFDDLYSTYGVKVQVANLSTIISDASPISAYFRAGSMVAATFCATLKENGQEVSMPISNENLPQVFAAREHAILNLSAKLTTGGAILSVDTVEIEKVTITQTIPMEWLPKPKVSGFADGATSVSYIETSDAIPAGIVYTASMPVQDVEFTLNFQDEQYMQLNKTYTLSTLTEEDKQVLNSAGITLPSLDGVSKQGTVDFTNLTANLQTNAGAEVVNTITIRVKANNRWSDDSNTYEIHTVRPDFTLSIQPENIWAKEFTADEINVTTGNADKIKSGLVYQYSEDGGTTWFDCNDSSNRRHAFASLPSNRDCKVRANYRNMYSNVADAMMEEPKQLPNSDMETWQINKMAKFFDILKFKNYTYYEFLPYASGEADVWWADNNLRAQAYSVSRVRITSASCVSCAEDNKHGGSRSALIYSSGHGGGYASTYDILYTDGAFAGSMFIGTYQYSDKVETITTGHGFPSRPGEFSFWYKYIPQNSDQFKVYVELKNGDEVIASGTYIPTATSIADANFSQATITLNYTTLQKKATSVYVQFLSTTKTTFESGDFVKSKSITYPVMGGWEAHIGSMLYIDDLSLNYTK